MQVTNAAVTSVEKLSSLEDHLAGLAPLTDAQLLGGSGALPLSPTAYPADPCSGSHSQTLRGPISCVTCCSLALLPLYDRTLRSLWDQLGCSALWGPVWFRGATPGYAQEIRCGAGLEPRSISCKTCTIRPQGLPRSRQFIPTLPTWFRTVPPGARDIA